MSLAIVVSHPIQYYSPWFRFLTAHGFPNLRVFYLWAGGTTLQLDHGFGRPVQWDIPLLEGYAHEFVPNRAKAPGTHHRAGLDNPELPARVRAFKPAAILLFGYNYRTHHRLIFGEPIAPIIFRGDSHRLVPASGVKAWLKRQWIARIYARMAAFLPVGQANAAYFRQHGVPVEKLFLAPHAVDNARFQQQSATAAAAAGQWKRDLGIAPGQRVILFAGKFETKKRPLDLLQAFVAAQIPDTVLLFVGNGALEPTLRARAAGRKDIVFAPFQNQSLMPRTYAAADLFVLPSYGPDETWGLAVNEAMCLGRPVIVSSHVGCGPDLVQSEENGLIFPAGNVAALTAALRAALSQPERLTAWGRRSQEFIANFDYAHATAGLRSALDFVAKRRR